MKAQVRKQIGAALLAVTLVALSPAAVRAEGSDIVDTAVNAGSFETLVAAVQAAGLVDALKSEGPFTVFAPTDEAFAKLPAGTVETLLKTENRDQLVDILTYHVVKGRVGAKQVAALQGAVMLNGQRVKVDAAEGKVTVDGAEVLKTDIACTNGIIHVIDAVILPESKSIPAVAEKSGQFGTLLAAAKAAGLVEALSGEGPLTVFAPTDAAFANLPKGTVETLLKPENKEKLVAILKYHVVSGRVYSEAALAAGKATTLQGQSVRIAASNGKASVNNAKLLVTDINASNGVIHVIDTVLLPAEREKVSMHDARQMIAQAVAHGSRMYNAGHHESCAQLYEATARRMTSYGDQMPSSVMATLDAALTQAQHTECPSARSWTLRRGLDQAYYSMLQR